jgi:peroxiredoxin family protein
MTTVALEKSQELHDEIAALRREIAELRERAPEEKAAIIVFSGDLDRLLASLVLATGAVAAGLETTMFFTFWGLSALKKKGAASGARSIKEKMFAMMTPSSTESMGVSKLNFFGMGAVMLRTMMKEKNVTSVEEMMALAREMGVKMIGCTMSMDVMGVTREQLADDIELGGVATFMAEAAKARFSLFI